MILGADNRKKWSKLDVLVMQAYQIIQDERCPHCNFPRWLCRNPDPLLDIYIVEENCEAKDEIDQYQEKRKDSKNGKKAGNAAYPQYRVRPGVEGMEIVDFRQRYYEQKGKDRAESEGGDPQD